MIKQTHLESSEHSVEPNIIESTPDYITTSLKKEAKGAKVEESFLRFVIEHIEKHEREGELPESYTKVDQFMIEKIAHLPEVFKQTSLLVDFIGDLRAKEEKNEPLSKDPKEADQYAEILRLMDVAKAIAKHSEIDPSTNSREIALVRDVETSINPLGKLHNATLIFFSDLHHAPSEPEETMREHAFKGYAPIRGASSLSDKLSLGNNLDVKGQSLLEDSNPNIENVNKRFIFKEAALAEFRDWLVDITSTKKFTSDKPDEKTPILFNIGDLVHDVGSLLDGVYEGSELLSMLDQINEQTLGQHAKLLEIYGNHDMDSRVPESALALSELFGHKIFTQELGEGVMLAAIDTNIQNPEWQKEFLARAGEAGKKLLAEKLEIQRQVIERFSQHQGSVVLIGHNPARIIDELAVKSDILQKSNVQRIIAGHTHKEHHVELPFKNKKGEVVFMDVVESFVTIKDGKAQAQKAYTLDVADGKVSGLRVIQEPQDQFEKAVEANF